MLIRWAHACSRSCWVVVVGCFKPPLTGEESTISLEKGTRRDPPGVFSVAFVAWGSAGRLGGSGWLTSDGRLRSLTVPCAITLSEGAVGNCAGDESFLRLAGGVEGGSMGLVLSTSLWLIDFDWFLRTFVCDFCAAGRCSGAEGTFVLKGSEFRVLLRKFRLSDILSI